MPWGVPFPPHRREQLERAALAGDVISARMLRDDLAFPEAVESLAVERGLPLRRRKPAGEVIDMAAARAARKAEDA